ncbi:hypothetical protein AB0I77_45825 [Streptomyces sp. NPDC050619]|uniref:hypothetical protein n=1 Tax=Streptomyces sp. NPDC050619 TaxID=3157214 RepID=UPI0034448E1A
MLCVHGIGQQFKGERVLHGEWCPALRDGVGRAGGTLGADDVRCLFYGDVFRPPGRPLSVGVPPYTAADVDDDFERELLLAWWAEAARTDPGVVDPDSRTLARVPRGAQAALRALSTSRFFSGLAVRMLVFDLKQVRRYLMDEDVRAEIQDRLATAVDADTRVVVGHSLGSVVAYEALAAHRTWPVRSLVTLGSPLGVSFVQDFVQGFVHDRLPSGQPGRWPGSVEQWTNIADSGDVVALRKDLGGLFGGDDRRVRDVEVHNGAHAHNVQPYLTAVETGRAILSGLR